MIATQCDAYVMHGDPAEAIAPKIADMEARRDAAGKGADAIRHGRLCDRPRQRGRGEARAGADHRSCRPTPPKGFDNFDQWLSGTQLERELKLQEYSVSNRGLRPNLVGTPEQVQERIAEYEAAGLDLLLLQMSPQAEEMERFAAQVIEPMRAHRPRSWPTRSEAPIRQDARPWQRLRHHRRSRGAVRGHARACESDCRPAYGRRLRPADRAGAQRDRRPQDAHLEQRRRRGRKLRQRYPVRRPADRRARASIPVAASSQAEDRRTTRSRSTHPEPRFAWEEIPLAYPMDTAALPLAWANSRDPIAVNVGNPHVVFFVHDAREVPLDKLGPTIENDPLSLSGSTSTSQLTSTNDLKLRTFERGAGETLACGTGACADRGRRDRKQASAVAGAGRHDGGRSDDRLGAGRADPDARRRHPRVQRRARPRGAAMSVETITLGCRLNYAESETIARSAPADEDWIVVNSCAVTNEAVRQTRQAIRRAHRHSPTADTRHRLLGPTGRRYVRGHARCHARRRKLISSKLRGE